MGEIYMGLGISTHEYHLGPIPMYFKLDIVEVAGLDEESIMIKTDIPGKDGQHISKMGNKSRVFNVTVVLSGTIQHAEITNQSKYLRGGVVNQHAVLATIRFFQNMMMPIVFKFGNIHTGLAVINKNNVNRIKSLPNEVLINMQLTEYYTIPIISNPLAQHVLNFNFTKPF